MSCGSFGCMPPTGYNTDKSAHTPTGGAPVLQSDAQHEQQTPARAAFAMQFVFQRTQKKNESRSGKTYGAFFFGLSFDFCVNISVSAEPPKRNRVCAKLQTHEDSERKIFLFSLFLFSLPFRVFHFISYFRHRRLVCAHNGRENEKRPTLKC